MNQIQMLREPARLTPGRLEQWAKLIETEAGAQGLLTRQALSRDLREAAKMIARRKAGEKTKT